MRGCQACCFSARPFAPFSVRKVSGLEIHPVVVRPSALPAFFPVPPAAAFCVCFQRKGDESTHKIPHPAGRSPGFQSSQFQVGAFAAACVRALFPPHHFSRPSLACVRVSFPVPSQHSVVAAAPLALVGSLPCVRSSPSVSSSSHSPSVPAQPLAGCGSSRISRFKGRLTASRHPTRHPIPNRTTSQHPNASRRSLTPRGMSCGFRAGQY